MSSEGLTMKTEIERDNTKSCSSLSVSNHSNPNLNSRFKNHMQSTERILGPQNIQSESHGPHDIANLRATILKEINKLQQLYKKIDQINEGGTIKKQKYY